MDLENDFSTCVSPSCLKVERNADILMPNRPLHHRDTHATSPPPLKKIQKQHSRPRKLQRASSSAQEVDCHSYNHAGAVFHPPLPPLLLSGGSRGGQPPSASVPPASSCCCPPRHRFLLLLLLLHAEREDPAAPKCSASVRTFGSLAL